MWMLSDRPLRGTGPPGLRPQRTGRQGDYSPKAQADVLAELIEARFAEPVHLFGNSMGVPSACSSRRATRI